MYIELNRLENHCTVSLSNGSDSFNEFSVYI